MTTTPIRPAETADPVDARVAELVASAPPLTAEQIEGAARAVVEARKRQPSAARRCGRAAA